MQDPVTTSTAAYILGWPESTVRLRANSGRLPSRRLPSGIRIFERAVLERIAQEETELRPVSGRGE
jgi:hypothetical protein